MNNGYSIRGSNQIWFHSIQYSKILGIYTTHKACESNSFAFCFTQSELKHAWKTKACSRFCASDIRRDRKRRTYACPMCLDGNYFNTEFRLLLERGRNWKNRYSDERRCWQENKVVHSQTVLCCTRHPAMWYSLGEGRKKKNRREWLNFRLRKMVTSVQVGSTANICTQMVSHLSSTSSEQDILVMNKL